MRKLWAAAMLLIPAAAGAEWLAKGDSAISSPAENTIRDQAATGQVTPVMTFRCEGGSVLAQVEWQRFISSFSTEIGFKIDGGKFNWFKWKIDNSEQVTVSPSADDTTKLIGLLENGSQLIADVSPYSEAPVAATFSLAGLRTALAELTARCQ